MYSLGEVEAEHFAVEVVKQRENRIVVAEVELVADMKLECSADFLCIDVSHSHQSTEKI